MLEERLWLDTSQSLCKSMLRKSLTSMFAAGGLEFPPGFSLLWINAVADPEGVHSNPPPCPPFLNILWKWNNLVTVRPNYFIFMGYLRKTREISKANPHNFIHMNPLSRNSGSATTMQPMLLALMSALTHSDHVFFGLPCPLELSTHCMVESLQDYSWIQDFEADFPQKASLKMLN